MSNQTGKEQPAQPLAEYAGYLLENECGLPKNESLRASAAALRESITGLLQRGEIDDGEMQFMIAQAIDILPEQDLPAAAKAHGFPADSIERISRAHASVLAAMRSARESLGG